MILKNKTIGVAVTGSFCTLSRLYPVLESLIQEEALVHTICSHSVQTIDCRFGNHNDVLSKLKAITGNDPILTISEAESIGPKKWLDALLIFPCTGNTIAKLAAGITDSPVLMAAKAHLRNERPLIISISTNDALSMNLKNIGILMNTKHIYFVPFGQDDPSTKTRSMIAHSNLIIPTIKAALDGIQYQPILISPIKQ